MTSVDRRFPHRPKMEADHGLLLLLLFVLLCLGGMPGRALAVDTEAPRLLDDKEATAVLERIKASQEGIKTIIASFTEERNITALARPLTFAGQVYAEPEDFLFLRYEEPLRHIMQMSGDNVLFFVEGSDTADMVDLAGARQQGQRPDLFNWSPLDFQGKVYELADGYLLTDQQAAEGGRQVRVVIDKENLVVRSLQMEDDSGDETIITLHNVRLNREIPAEIRHYSLPHGVRIHKMNQ